MGGRRRAGPGVDGGHKHQVFDNFFKQGEQACDRCAAGDGQGSLNCVTPIEVERRHHNCFCHAISHLRSDAQHQEIDYGTY